MRWFREGSCLNEYEDDDLPLTIAKMMRRRRQGSRRGPHDTVIISKRLVLVSVMDLIQLPASHAFEIFLIYSN